VLVRAALDARAAAAVLAPEVEEYAGERPRALPAALLTVLGMAAVLAGAHFVVQGATGLARAAGVSDVVIGVTVVAVGTSLPELVTAAAAARRGETDLVIGNVLGSNLFNSLGVAGVAGLIGTVPLSPSFGPNALVMLGACALAAVLLGTGRVLSRPEGAVLLVLFAGAIATAVALG
jgi:cation:H+ antiporter